MAKRKRLSPVDPAEIAAKSPVLETHSAFPASAPPRAMKPAPIADVAQDSAATAALQEVTDTLARAREDGRMVLDLPLAAVDETYLVRDRTRMDPEEMEALRASIAMRGQQTPIEVAALDGERYGLISGWRRLQALRQLAAEGDGASPGTVQALLRKPDDSADAYLSMIEENEIRVALSYYERARIAARAVEQGVFPTEKKALLTLYRAASRAKRSKIRSFLALVRALDGQLRFPEDIPERLGLTLAQALDADPDAPARFRAELLAADPQTPEAEKACLLALLKPAPAPTRPVPDRPRAGIAVERAGPSRVVLSGPAVDDRLYQRLLAFLVQAE